MLDPDTRERLRRASSTDVSILLTGETGTGKGQMARAIVAESFRKEIVEVNCAALPDELLGSELFGHRKGAFTGATADRKGLLLSSAGKTVFLDEIGEISPRMQRMLLRAVQRSARKIKPLGADRELDCPPLRFIFATNRLLEEEVLRGNFREDLLRRIDVVTVELPPLRKRRDLIEGYVGKFLTELAAIHAIDCTGIERSALKCLREHIWTGNVRELKNVLERALVTAPREKGVVIRKADLNIELKAEPTRGVRRQSDAEADNIRNALRLTGGNISRTVEMLGLPSRGALYYRMKKFGIDKDLAAGSKLEENDVG